MELIREEIVVVRVGKAEKVNFLMNLIEDEMECRDSLKSHGSLAMNTATHANFLIW